MIAYQLLARLRHLTLIGFDENQREYEWIGTNEQWNKVEKEEELILKAKFE